MSKGSAKVKRKKKRGTEFSDTGVEQVGNWGSIAKV